jgi:hypothetical protein
MSGGDEQLFAWESEYAEDKFAYQLGLGHISFGSAGRIECLR